MKNNIVLERMVFIVNILFLIILENFVLDSGMGYFGFSILFLSLLFSIMSGNFSAGIQKMVSNRNSRGLNGSNGKILRVGLIYQTIVSLLILILSFVFALLFLKKYLGDQYSTPILLLLVLALSLNGWIHILNGYIRGNDNDSIYHLSQILSMILPIILSIPLLHTYMKKGELVAQLLKTPVIKNVYMVMGIALTFVISYAIILLLVVLIATKNHELFRSEKSLRIKEQSSTIINNFHMLTLNHLINYLFSALALFVPCVLFLSTGHKNNFGTMELYTQIGVLFSKVLLPIFLVFVIYSAYVSYEKNKLRIDYHNGEQKLVVMRSQFLLKNSLFLLLPPTIVYLFLGDPFARVFFTGEYSLSSLLIRKSGLLILLGGFVYLFHQILKSFTKDYLVTIMEGISFIVQIIAFIILLKKNFSVTAVIYSLEINLGFQLLMSACLFYRFVRINLVDFGMKLVKCLGGAAAMALIFIILDKFIMMNVFLMILSIVLGYFVYYITIIALKGMTKREVQSMKRTLNYYPLQFLSSLLNVR